MAKPDLVLLLSDDGLLPRETLILSQPVRTFTSSFSPLVAATKALTTAVDVL